MMGTSMGTLFKYPVVFAISLAVTYALTPLVTRLAAKWGMVDMPDSRKIHAFPTPRSGGIAVFAGVHAACAAIYLLPWPYSSGNLDASWWRAVLFASGALLVVGIVDDVRGLKPWLKLSGQTAAAFIMLDAGWSFQILLGHQLPMWLDMVLTVVWILFFINAFNLIDGLDGLSTGLGIIAALGMAGCLLVRNLPGDALVLVALVGACAAFLRFNFHPASIFLGDTGSMFIGFFLASVALGTGSKGTVLVSVGGPLLAAGVPAFDVMLALWRRSFWNGKGAPANFPGSFLAADMGHLHHRMLTWGIDQRGVAVCLYAINVLLVALGLLSLFYASLAVSIFLVLFVIAGYLLVRQGIPPDRDKDHRK